MFSRTVIVTRSLSLTTKSSFIACNGRRLSRSLSTFTTNPLTHQRKLFSTATTTTSTTTEDATPPPPPPESSSGSSLLTVAVLSALAFGGAYYMFPEKFGGAPNYQKIYNDIAEILDSDSDYDDGSFGPIFVRLAWHASGTYDKVSGTGGSNGSTMRFDPESGHGANAGLAIARDLLEPIKEKYPSVSHADLWSLAGVVAIQEMGGPTIPWRPGRSDAIDATACTPDGRLPDASQGQDHLRNIFYRMGFNDQEIVALNGAHVLGRCHTDRSGYTNPWSRSPTTFSNDFYKLLLSEKWVKKSWKGPKQFEDKSTKELMMLPSDMSLLSDKSFKRWVDIYANDSEKFFADFALAFKKLEELGVPFQENTPTIKFKRL